MTEPAHPASLEGLPVSEIKAVFSDLDGTLTDEPFLSPETYAAVWALHGNGFKFVVVSGRPAGWADCLMRLLPIDAVVFENGAGVLLRRGERLEVEWYAGPPTTHQQRLQQVFAQLKKSFPQLKLAQDQRFRLFDYAIDFNEEPPRLAADQVEAVMAELSQIPDVTAKLSSIHINYWVGDYTKVTACSRLLAEEGRAWNLTKENVVFSGDSPNDEPLFEFFRHSVGVANVGRFLSKMRYQPRYLTTRESGKGFQELALRLNTARIK